jgi:hypothetical protein
LNKVLQLLESLFLESNRMKKVFLLSVLLFAGFSVAAKLPPLSDEAKAKADEAKAKAAHGDKVAAFQLCNAQDRVAARYVKDLKAQNKEAKPATATAACADPGAFVWPPAPAATVAAAAPPAAAPATKK